jgi:hypothetical protein
MVKSEIQNSGNNSLRAILIGIDFYFPNSLPDGGSYLSLGGCVNDITRVENFLTGRLGMKRENIIKLTASNPDGFEEKPLESSEKWPTYDNMVKAFKHVTESAESGDQVCIYYSGHGGRAKTSHPEIKGKDGIDEGLVPTDIGNPESNYLRDIEIAHLLKKMVDKGLVVIMFLDSCHSGGSTRGPIKAAVRGLSTIDTTDRVKDSLVASNEELISSWSELSKTDIPATRNITRTSGWLPEAKGYTLLAACRQHEYAIEDQFPELRSGVLTYYLLESLYSQRRNGINYKMLYDTVIAKVHSRYSSQTPVLEGETDRMVFGSDYLKTESGANVIEVMDSEQIKLNAGIAQGVGKDAQFAIYPSNSVDLKASERLAIVKVSSVSASNCMAEITKRFVDNRSIKEGDKALLTNIGSIEKKRKVVLVNQEKDSSLSPTEQKKYFDSIQFAISSSGKGFVELVEMNRGDEKNLSTTIDYQVAINSKGEYEIWDAAGVSIPNLNPPIRMTESNSAERVVSRLVHLGRYNHVQQLNNYDDPLNSTDKKLDVKLFHYQDNFESKKDSELKPIESLGNVTTLKTGEEVVARIYNNSQQPLNITALDLQPDWGISQIIPDENKGDFETLEPGKYMDFPFQTGLPEGYTEGKDTIKIFATVKPTQFRWLLLPPLDQPITRSVVMRGKGPKNSLEELFANLSEDTSSTKGVYKIDKTKSANVEWMTTQLEILINNRNLQ